MHRERLTHLRNELSNPNLINFNLERILSRRSDNRIPSSDLIIKGELKTPGCGTTACAVGFFPVFFPEDFHYKQGFPYLKSDDEFSSSPDFVDGGSCEETGWYLELTKKEWDYLFEPSYYEQEYWSDPLAVVDRIDQLLAGEEFKLVRYSSRW